MSALAAVRNKVEEVSNEIVAEAIDGEISSGVAETVTEKLQEILSFIDSLALDDKLECCRS